MSDESSIEIELSNLTHRKGRHYGILKVIMPDGSESEEEVPEGSSIHLAVSDGTVLTIKCLSRDIAKGWEVEHLHRGPSMLRSASFSYYRLVGQNFRWAITTHRVMTNGADPLARPN